MDLANIGKEIRKKQKAIDVPGLSADEVLSDSLDKSYESRASEYLDRIRKLTKKEQERLFSMIELFLDS